MLQQTDDLEERGLNKLSPLGVLHIVVSLCWKMLFPWQLEMKAQLDELQSQFAPDNAGSALKALDRRAAIIGVKQPIDLRAASFH